MKPFSTVEKWALALAALFVIVGLHSIVRPSDGLVIYLGGSATRGVSSTAAWGEHVSKERSQAYGGLCVAIGIAIGWVTVRYGRR